MQKNEINRIVSSVLLTMWILMWMKLCSNLDIPALLKTAAFFGWGVVPLALGAYAGIAFYTLKKKVDD